MRVEGRVAIVTGGASGLGAATAKLLAAEGAAVLVSDINGEGAETVAAEIVADGGKAVGFRHDVADEAQWEAAYAKAKDELGTVSILFNNAGVSPESQRLEDVELSTWRRETAINIDGVFLGMKHGIRAMKENGGAIVSTSSIYGIAGAGLTGAYSAAKGAVRTLSKAAAMECAHLGYNIRINSIHPGFIQTAMVEKVKSEFGLKAFENTMVKKTPMGHIGEPRDIAEGVLYLVSDSGKFVTGIELPVDGGFLAQ